jgi:hypothetical protein
MNFRELTPSELISLPEQFYIDCDHLKTSVRYLPTDAVRSVIAEDEDGMAGVWIVRAALHCGPIWVRKDLRGRSKAVRNGMWALTRSIINENGGSALMIVLDDKPKVNTIIEQLAGEKVPGSLYMVRG